MKSNTQKEQLVLRSTERGHGYVIRNYETLGQREARLRAGRVWRQVRLLLLMLGGMVAGFLAISALAWCVQTAADSPTDHHGPDERMHAAMGHEVAQ